MTFAVNWALKTNDLSTISSTASFCLFVCFLEKGEVSFSHVVVRGSLHMNMSRAVI